MRISLKRQPWDIYFALTYLGIVAIALMSLNVMTVVGTFLILALPGYMTVAAMFPRRERLSPLERTALSLALGLTIIFLLAVSLSLARRGASPGLLFASTASFTVSTGIIALFRRRSLPIEDRPGVAINLGWPGWDSCNSAERITTAVLVVAIAVSIGALAYVQVSSQFREKYSEFFLLGPTGVASGYPSDLNVSQPGTLIFGVVNHEGAMVDYSVRIDLVGLIIGYNATTGANETVESNRTTFSWSNVTLADGRNWTQPYTFRISAAGLWKVQFLLFKDGDFSNAYRALHLYVRVA